jgi:hypothetical protein
VPGNPMKLAAFLALAQHEVQQTLEYLAHPEVRQISTAAPSQVLATVGNVKLTVPLHFAIGPSPRRPQRPPGAAPQPEELLLPGAPWPPGSKMLYQINVANPQGCTETGFPNTRLGSLTVEFITVLKQS